jgi:hypothetical protein
MNPSRLHCIRLFIRGLLMLLCILSVPRFASSEPGTTAPNEKLSPKRPKIFHQGAGYPAPSSVGMLRDNDDCATTKLDIWLKQGMMTYTISMHQDDLRFKGLHGAEGRTTTLLIGGPDCLIRVRIQPVPAGTTIYD